MKDERMYNNFYREGGEYVRALLYLLGSVKDRRLYQQATYNITGHAKILE
jgi:hypothetical protein